MAIGFALLWVSERIALLRFNRKPLETDKNLVATNFKETMNFFVFFHCAMLIFLLKNFSTNAKDHGVLKKRGEDIIPNGNFDFAGE